MRTWLVGLACLGCSVQSFGTAEGEDAGGDVEEVGEVEEWQDAGDAETGEAEVGGEGGSPSCPGTAGPTMVQVPGGYCIDSTEVTNGQYAVFLAAGYSMNGQLAECSGNVSYTPPFDWPATGREAYPVVWVDWCDAYAFCKWAGKRLCGKIGGGANPGSDLADVAKSQWYAACSAGGTLTYPYGGTYEGTTCNGEGGETIPVGSATGCEGGYPGIYDLSGNVWEWEDSCDGKAGALDGCRMRGGSFNFNLLILACNYDVFGVRGDDGSDIGFRCCS